MAEERRTPTAPQRRHDATLNLKRRITSPMRMPAIALDWRLLGWPAVYVIARWWLHLARPSCVVLHSAGVPAPPRPRAYARVAAVGGAAVYPGTAEVATNRSHFAGEDAARRGATNVDSSALMIKLISRQTTDLTGPSTQDRACGCAGARTVPAARAAPRVARRCVERRRSAVESVRLILFFYSRPALGHMRETRRGRGDSRIRQRRLSSACTQCLRPAASATVWVSAAATLSSDVHPTLGDPLHRDDVHARPLRRGDVLVPHRARAAAIARAPSPRDSASCLAGTLPDTMLAPISRS